MTRFVYGGGGDSEVNAPSGIPRASAPAGIYSAFSGGVKVTDTQALDGTPLSGTVTTDAYGQAIFLGPDGYTATLWLDYGTGPRWGVAPKQLDQPNAGGKVIADQRTLDYSGRTVTTKSGLPTNSSVPLLDALAQAADPLLIPRFPSSATLNAAFPSPNDGDRAYRTDAHARMQYSAAVSRWIAEEALIGEVILGSTANSVTFSSIPQTWNHLRLVIKGRCAASSQTHKWGVETYAQLNADSTAADYNFTGPSSFDKIVSGTTTYNLSTVDATAGSTTTPYSPYFATKTAFAGDLGARIGMLPGESTPAAMMGSSETIIPNYSTTGQSILLSRSGAMGFGATNYALYTEYTAGWSGTAAITSLAVALFTGALMGIGTSVRLYGF